MKVHSDKYVPAAEAKGVLSKIAEAKPSQKNTLEILDKMVRLKPEDAANLSQELLKISKLTERHIAMICDFLPADKDDLRMVLGKEFSILTEDEANLVLEAVKKFA